MIRDRRFILYGSDRLQNPTSRSPVRKIIKFGLFIQISYTIPLNRDYQLIAQTYTKEYQFRVKKRFDFRNKDPHWITITFSTCDLMIAWNFRTISRRSKPIFVLATVLTIFPFNRAAILEISQKSYLTLQNTNTLTNSKPIFLNLKWIFN
jgi:hypothetical protein